MKRKRIINIRKCAATLALLTTTIIAGITNSSAAEANNVTNINNSKPETSSTIITDANQQRLAGGLIIDPTTLRPVASISDYFGKNQQWVSVNDVFEERLGPDGNITGRRNHDYKVIKIEEVTTKDGAVEEVKTAECQSCGHIMTLKKTIKEADHNHGTGGGSHGGGGSSSGGSGDNKPVHIHNWSSWTPINDTEHRRTCLAEGCTIKTQTYKHTFSEWSEWSEWTLTTDAEGKQIEVRTRTQTCADCGYVKSEKQTRPYNPGHIHNWSEWKVTKPATCTTTGERTRTCLAEGCTIKTQTESIPALGHKYGEWIVSQDWHVVTKPDGTQVEQRTLEQTCSVCGNKNTKTEERPYIPGHTHDLRTSTSYENISIGNGEHKHKVITTIACTGCDYKEVKEAATTGTLSIGKNDDGHYEECQLCHAKTDSVAHNYKYTTSGNVSTGICETCGYTKTHNHTASTVSPEDACPFYTSPETCQICHETYTIYGAHILEYKSTNDITNKELWACKCGKVSEYRDPEPCEHVWGDWTKISDSEDLRECSKCHRTQTTNHSYVKGFDSTSHYEECANCHDIINRENHNITYSENGNVVIGKCSECDYTNSHNHTASAVSPEDACSFYTSPETCQICHKTYTIYGEHRLEYKSTNDITNKELWACKCGKVSEYRDAVTNNNSITESYNLSIPEDNLNTNNKTNDTQNPLDKSEDIEVIIPIDPIEEESKGESSSNTSASGKIGNEDIYTDQTPIIPPEDENTENKELGDTDGEVFEKDQNIDQEEPNTKPDISEDITTSGNEDDITEIIESGDREVDQIIADGNKELEAVIENGKQEIDQQIDLGSQEVETVIEAGDKEVDEVMERSTAELQVRMEQADAELAAILANSPMKRVRKLF